MKILHTFNEENASQEEVGTYKVRQATRTIVFDAEGNIALLHMTNKGYYELPGGGVEPGETLEEGCIRECREEIGCVVEILSEVGSTLEYRKRLERVNHSSCFTAKVIGEKGTPDLQDDEIEVGTETLWVSKEKAIELIESSVWNNLYDKYVIERSVVFLKAI
jgi:8-oxo-dGTP diphosphatase